MYVEAGVVSLGVGWYLWRRFNRPKPPASRDTFRRKLIERYGHRCMVCGYKKTVHAHHINARAKNGSNDPNRNGILLCPNCHALADSGKISKRKLRNCKRKAELKRKCKFW